MIKLSNFFILVISFLILAFITTNAQSRVVNVAQGVGTLNATIDGDTTATGERNEPENTVYVLERDGYYLTDGSITNDGWPLRIKAADGTGARPIIQPAVIQGGSSTYPFRPRGDFYVTGLYITNMDQDGLLLDRPIRASADSIRIVVDDCHIDYAAQAAFRIDNAWNKIYITNSIISNMGRMSSPDNGRGVDDRGNDIDTLIMANNTFYNLTSRIIRDGGGIINYCKVDHNTLVNIAQRGCTIGEAIEAYFTNNLIINAGFLGSPTVNPPAIIEIGALGQDYIDSGYVQVVVVDNNNYYIDPSLVSTQPDSVNQVPLYDSTTAALVAQFSTGIHNIEEDVQFTSSPNLPTDVITSWYDNAVAPEDKTDMDDGGGGPRPGQGVPVQSPFDFAYANTYQSYTASSSGEQIGSLTWFGTTVGVNDGVGSNLPENFTLFQNYPNPFNPTTTIGYKISKASSVSLIIYNSLGQVVKTLVNSNQSVGNYNVRWNGTNELGTKVTSGIYFYRLSTGEYTNVKKMIMLK